MRVVVLMSTYEGEPYVAQQIESILSQLPPDGRLMVRDDGSRDRTISVVRSIRDARVHLVCGPNLGFARSFFTLMRAVPADAEMIMLSDQDDVWLPHKIMRAWNHLSSAGDTPTLYCTRQQLVDGELQPIALSNVWPRAPSFQNALTENIVTGCTAAFNPAALRLAMQLQSPEEIYFHDWWLYLVISAFGNVVADPDAPILYRQHGGNAIGRGSGLKLYFQILRFIRKRSWAHIMYRQIGEFRMVYQEKLSPAQKHLVYSYFDPRKPAALLKLLFAPKRFRQTLLGDLLLRLLLVAEVVSGRGLLPATKPTP